MTTCINVILRYLLVALLLKSLVALSSLSASQLGVLLLEDGLHNEVIHLEKNILQTQIKHLISKTSLRGR